MSSAPKICGIAAIGLFCFLPLQASLESTTLFQQQSLLSQTKPHKRKETRLSRSIRGYDELLRRFRIDRATQGFPNSIDESLLVTLSATAGKYLDSAWWLNPIANGKPRYSWADFTELFDRVDHLLEGHRWLREWRAAGQGRRLELHALGRQTSGEGLNTFVLPIWREAGLRGDAVYTVLARLPDSSWIQLNLNDQKPSILVAYSTGIPFTHPLHWLDALDVQFHPQCTHGEQSSRYAVVNTDGSHQIRTFQRCPH